MRYNQVYILDRQEKFIEMINVYFIKYFDPSFEKEVIFIMKNTK